jgi:hypothetical protein
MPKSDGQPYPLADEYALASRLSYFLWSTMPDEELFRLAEQGQLRTQLDKQIERMIKHQRSQALIENFVGQWLRARDVAHVRIDARTVVAADQPPPTNDKSSGTTPNAGAFQFRGRFGRFGRGPMVNFDYELRSPFCAHHARRSEFTGID